MKVKKILLFLVCAACKKERGVKHANYLSSKTKRSKENKLNLKKFCNFCRSSTLHLEEIISSKKAK